MNTDFEVQPTTAFDRTHFAKLFAPPEPAAESSAVALDDPAVAALAQANIFDSHGREEAARGHFNASRVLHERAIEIRRQWLGAADPQMSQSFTWLGTLAIREGRLDEAQWLCEQARTAAEKLRGPAHPRVAAALNNLGVLARMRGDLTRAADYYEQALAIKLDSLGWDHPSVGATLANLGNLARESGDLRTALCYFARAREILEDTEGGTSPTLATVLVGMGRVHLQFGACETARWVLERALRIREAAHVTPSQLAAARLLLGTALLDSHPEDARELVVVALREYETSVQPRQGNITAMEDWLRGYDRGHAMRMAS